MTALAGVMLAACATPQGTELGPGAPTTTAGAGAEPTDTARPTGQIVTLQGTVEEGVELGCLVLRADNGEQYLLLGGDPQVLGSGGRIEVQGVLRTDIATTCMQGTPISVVYARRVG
jgi:hypothetical protein